MPTSPLALTQKKRAARREAAIVTHVPGTTRDILELSLDIGGLPVLVSDTAGLRETADEVEQIGIERARKACVASFVCDDFCACLAPPRELKKPVSSYIT
jgi:predicted GTPase